MGVCEERDEKRDENVTRVTKKRDMRDGKERDENVTEERDTRDGRK